MIRPACILLCSIWAPVALGHQFEAGYLGLDEAEPGEWIVTWAPPPDAPWLAQLAPVLPCEGTLSRRRCTGALGPVGVAGLPPTATQVLTRVRWADGAQWSTVLTAGAPTARPVRTSGILGSVGLGWRHLWQGWDHLAFVALLGLCASGARPLIAAVGAFTLGHALTLALVMLGGWSLPSAPVEAAIALSIAWLARVRLLEDEAVHPVGWAGGFGLLHGLGFAGALSEVGLPSRGLWRVLLGFHLGLEGAQLAWLGLLAAPLLLWNRLPERARPWPLWALGGLGTAAFLVRLGALGGAP